MFFEIEKIKKLIEDKTVRVLPDKIEIDIDLMKLCDDYGPIKGEYFSTLLNKLLKQFDDMGYEIKQFHDGGLCITTTITKRKNGMELDLKLYEKALTIDGFRIKDGVVILPKRALEEDESRIIQHLKRMGYSIKAPTEENIKMFEADNKRGVEYTNAK